MYINLHVISYNIYKLFVKLRQETASCKTIDNFVANSIILLAVNF